MATTNRKKEYDLSFVTCDQDSCCAQIFQQIWHAFIEERYKCKQIVVGNETTARDIFYSSSKSVVVVLLSCKHSQKVQNDFAKQYCIDAHINVVIGHLDTVRFASLRKCSHFIGSEGKVKSFISHIKQTLDQKAEYTDIRSLSAKEEATDHVYETIVSVRNPTNLEQENIDDTPLKYTWEGHMSSSLTIGECEEVFHRASSALKEDFIDPRSLLRKCVPWGPFVKESYTSPTKTFHCPPNELPRLYIHGSDEAREDLAKHIVAQRGPALFKSRDLFNLVLLTKCMNRSIQTKLFEFIEELVYTREVSKCNVQELLSSVKELIQNLPQCIGDHVLFLKIVHVITASFGILYLWTLERGCDKHLEDAIDDVCYKVKDCPSMEDIGYYGECLKYAIKSMHAIANSLRNKLKNISTLKIGHWRDALAIKETRTKIEEDLKNFSEIEHFACVLGISNQILQVSNARNVEYLKFLRRVVETIAKLSSKKKDYTIFHVCIVLIKMIAFVASKPELSESGTDGSSDCEYKSTLLNILSLVLEGKLLSQLQRQHLIDIVKPLLFHTDKNIVHHFIRILGKNNFKASDFRRMVLPHIESTLLALNVKLDHMEYDIEEINGPVWKSLHGRIAYDSKVQMTVLFPTLHCISKGGMYNYTENAKPDRTKYHTTHLETLHVLNSISHHNICRLIAYQTRPLPYFYITERYHENDLSKYLLRMRHNNTWLPEGTLIILTTGLIEAVMFLHSKGVIHRNLTTSTFALNSDDTPVLCDFGMALHLSDKDGYATDTTENIIPLRWSPALSILEDRFDSTTDKYMVGMMIYEMFTHGCQPFTELYNMDLGKILEMVIFQDLKPRHTPCIPRPIHDLMLKFLSCDGSFTLQDGLQTLEQYLSKSKGTQMSDMGPLESLVFVDRRLRPSDSHCVDWKYPELSSRQGKPERELPEFIKNFKVSGTNPRQTYFNLRASQRKQTALISCTEADLLSPEDPELDISDPFVTVIEPVNSSFLEEVLPRIMYGDVWTDLAIREKPKIDRNPNEKQNLIYTLEGVNIIDIALRNIYGDPYDDEPAQHYLQVVIKLVEFVCKMHSANFVLKDICGKVMYVAKDGKGKVSTTRIGRMTYLGPRSTDDCLVDKKFSERLNWLPIEVIDDNQYSFESDIYMLAMTIHEFYSALDLYRDNPSANKLKCIPFPMVSRDKLRDHLLCGEIPEQSNACSPDLYDILKTCWNRDRTQRPSAETLKGSLIKLIRGEAVRSNQIIEENQYLPDDPPSPCSSSESSLLASKNKYLELLPNESGNVHEEEPVKEFRHSIFKRTIKPHIQTDIVRPDHRMKFNPCFIESASLDGDVSYTHYERAAAFSEKDITRTKPKSQSEIVNSEEHFERTRLERQTFRGKSFLKKSIRRFSQSTSMTREKRPLENSAKSVNASSPPNLIVREISIESTEAETDSSRISFANSSSGNISSDSTMTFANPSSDDSANKKEHSEDEYSVMPFENYSKVDKDTENLTNKNDYESDLGETYEELVADDKPYDPSSSYLECVFHSESLKTNPVGAAQQDQVLPQNSESSRKAEDDAQVRKSPDKTHFEEDAIGYQDFDPFYLQWDDIH